MYLPAIPASPQATAAASSDYNGRGDNGREQTHTNRTHPQTRCDQHRVDAIDGINSSAVFLLHVGSVISLLL